MVLIPKLPVIFYGDGALTLIMSSNHLNLYTLESHVTILYIYQKERESSVRECQDGEGGVLPLFGFFLSPHQGFQLFAITEATAGPPGKRHRGE